MVNQEQSNNRLHSNQLSYSAEAILSNSQLSRTPIRLSILSFFLNLSHAATKNEIESNLTNYDRITVYRTLKSFEKKGLIHRVLGFEGEPKFALSDLMNVDKKEEHDHAHVHFHCLKCETTICLPCTIPEITIPKNFQIVTKSYSIEGICKNCIMEIN